LNWLLWKAKKLLEEEEEEEEGAINETAATKAKN
jgi:hypothetical protein